VAPTRNIWIHESLEMRRGGCGRREPRRSRAGEPGAGGRVVRLFHGFAHLKLVAENSTTVDTVSTTWSTVAPSRFLNSVRYASHSSSDPKYFIPVIPGPADPINGLVSDTNIPTDPMP
jgi:hypothetical protein